MAVARYRMSCLVLYNTFRMLAMVPAVIIFSPQYNGDIRSFFAEETKMIVILGRRLKDVNYRYFNAK